MASTPRGPLWASPTSLTLILFGADGDEIGSSFKLCP